MAVILTNPRLNNHLEEVWIIKDLTIIKNMTTCKFKDNTLAILVKPELGFKSEAFVRLEAVLWLTGLQINVHVIHQITVKKQKKHLDVECD